MPVVSYRRVLAFALMALFAVLVTGCRIELAITVHEDGSGEISQIVAVNTELMESFGEEFSEEEFSDALDLENLMDDVPEGFEAQPYEQGKFQGVQLTGSFDANDVGTLHAKLETSQEATAVEGGMGSFLEDVSLSREGVGWRFSARVPPNPASSEMESEDELGIGALMEGLLEEFIFEIRVVLPGDTLEHNADRIENGALVWEIAFDQTEPRSLAALTGETETEPIDIVVGIGVLIIAAAAIGGLVFWLVLRRRRRTPDLR